MTVERKTPSQTLVSNLIPGDIFELDDTMYILVEDGELHDGNKLPYVRLTDGLLDYIDEDYLVTPYYNAKMIY